jgi:hypothetical protein
MFFAFASRMKFWKPRARLSPLVITKRSPATGLSQKKLVGATMFSHLRTQKAARRRSLSDSPGVSKYMSCSRWVKARYHSLMMSQVAALVQIGSEKRESSGLGSMTSSEGMPSARRTTCACKASRSPDSALVARISSCGCIIQAIWALSSDEVTPYGSTALPMAIPAVSSGLRPLRSIPWDFADEIADMLVIPLPIMGCLYHRPEAKSWRAHPGLASSDTFFAPVSFCRQLA